MNFGPLEFAAHLRRKVSPESESPEVEAARASVIAPRPDTNRLTIISGPRTLRRAMREESVRVFEAIATGAVVLPRVGKPVRVSVTEVGAPAVLVLSYTLGGVAQ